MIIHCLNFGALWWMRPGRNHESAAKFTTEAAVFNTTGFVSGARERRNWIVAGVIRFNVGTCNEQRVRPEQLGQSRFVSPGPERSGSLNRLLLTRRARSNVPADLLLACISEEEHGRILFDSDWRSPGVRILSSSEFGRRQQSLVLMPIDGIVNTEIGEWRCSWTGRTGTLTRMPANVSAITTPRISKESEFS
jgi:hypothetical protein